MRSGAKHNGILRPVGKNIYQLPERRPEKFRTLAENDMRGLVEDFEERGYGRTPRSLSALRQSFARGPVGRALR